MRIHCPFCSGKARISSRHDLNDEKTIADLYCQCLDAKHCGATFVYSLSYKSLTNPPLKSAREMAFYMVSKMPKSEKEQLQKDLFNV
jgi:hypothetical protein